MFFLSILSSLSIFGYFFPRPTPLYQPTPTPKTCPSGFILVPGNPQYKTNDFCVMKYDAKCDSLEPPVGNKCTNEGTYKNNSPECYCKKVVSTATGFPITYIAETDNTPDNAKNYCQQNGWHLLTNNEWMTIAKNVEQVPANWCNQDGTYCNNTPGTIGKILANGHNDNSAQALPASTDDQPCFGTTTDHSNICGHPSSQKRTLTLSNGQIIWDLAGNVWQWIDIQIARKDQPQSKTNGILDRGWIWSEFAPGGKKTVITTISPEGPSNPKWNSTNGIGRIYHFSGPLDDNHTLYTYIRGGNWRHGYDSGAFTVHMSPVATKENIDDVGFRCAL